MYLAGSVRKREYDAVGAAEDGAGRAGGSERVRGLKRETGGGASDLAGRADGAGRGCTSQDGAPRCVAKALSIRAWRSNVPAFAIAATSLSVGFTGVLSDGSAA